MQGYISTLMLKLKARKLKQLERYIAEPYEFVAVNNTETGKYELNSLWSHTLTLTYSTDIIKKIFLKTAS